jgi:hypothetical protein
VHQQQSIAALLPAQPQHGPRVIVSRRPNPPLPDDVAASHPLRDERTMRALLPSPQAGDIETLAGQELRRLLGGTTVEQDLLGLLIAAGGGLTSADLADLLACPVLQVEEALRGASGRAVLSSRSQLRPRTNTFRHVLGHAELLKAALTALGSDRLLALRCRLHSPCLARQLSRPRLAFGHARVPAAGLRPHARRDPRHPTFARLRH